MGYLLKEALKILCGLNQWSYAVFWKFGCQNPKLLIWEECFFEPVPYSNLPGNSGALGGEPGLESLDTCPVLPDARASHLTALAGHKVKVHLLVNKMMKENHVNIVGEGLVGRAAFTGYHQWILAENYSGVTHPPEVLKEVYQQFSAGMTTVAVIPVLPHGVVQLGSSLAVLENLAFVNDVKTLVRQLAGLPGVLLTNDYTPTEPARDIGLPVYTGTPLSADSSTGSDMISSFPFSGSCNNHVTLTQTAGFVSQTSYPLAGQVLEFPKSSGPSFLVSNIPQDLSKIHNHLYQANIPPLAKPDLPTIGQLFNGVARAEVIMSHPKAQMNQRASIYSERSVSEQQSSNSLSAANSGNFRLLEGRILTDGGSENQTDHNLAVCDGFSMAQVRPNTSLISVPSVKVSELLEDADNQLSAIPDVDSFQGANRSSNTNITSVNPSGDVCLDANSSKTEESSLHEPENSKANHVQHSASVNCHQSDSIGIKTERNAKEQMDNETLRGMGISPSQRDENINICDLEKLGYGAKKSGSPGSSKREDVCMPHQCGSDLFDVLGVDYRNNLLHGSWNNSLHNESHANSQTYENMSTSLASECAASDLFSVNQGASESGIFSMTVSDNLLDAVVSNVRPIKQNLDDSVSRQTTLTNISNSSSLVTSHSYGRASVPDQIPGELFDFPNSLLKEGAPGGYLFKSSNSNDNLTTYSQCGSQISSWVQQSQDIKQSSSVSTAYSKKPQEASKPSRKRLKPGENPRPRPKDRQMIQDRVKELREIVPNGAKCSIDALLERTIKHMLFLQSVTKHADKLKRTGESKILSEEGGNGGATWAYEVGSQSVVCPIIVEDLNQPRQMLVEMLCEEQGLSLEIADIIRGLGLTILKGVIETRNDKIWSRFIVEANRDVTRMEIFLSLVRLLEKTPKDSAIPANVIVNDAMEVEVAPKFHQAASIPTMGTPCGLQ